jgi:hypothetical protein
MGKQILSVKLYNPEWYCNGQMVHDDLFLYYVVTFYLLTYYL